MVYEDSQTYTYDYSQCDADAAAFGSSGLLVDEQQQQQQQLKQIDIGNQLKRADRDDVHLVSFKMPYQKSFRANNWSELAESTLPLRSSALLANAGNYGGLHQHENGQKLIGGGSSCGDSSLDGRRLSHQSELFHDSLERRSKEMSRKLIYVNFISLLINLLLAVVALYFSFVSNSSSTTAFAADCLLDFISSAIVLWRYYGDLNDVYMHAREQIACIYLGALFEISALGIMIKASSDIISGPEATASDAPGYDLLYLAMAAVIACSVLIAFKWSLYTTIRDKSILLDVINTVISTIFALTLCLMTILSNFDASFWYFDPVLSIILAVFMAGFGLKVIHQNFHILHPKNNDNTASFFESPFAKLNSLKSDTQYSTLTSEANSQDNHGIGSNVRPTNWQKADHTLIAFI